MARIQTVKQILQKLIENIGIKTEGDIFPPQFCCRRIREYITLIIIKS